MTKSLSILTMALAMVAPLYKFPSSMRHKREVKRHNEQLEAETMRKAEEKRLRKQQKRLAHAFNDEKIKQ